MGSLDTFLKFLVSQRSQEQLKIWNYKMWSNLGTWFNSLNLLLFHTVSGQFLNKYALKQLTTNIANWPQPFCGLKSVFITVEIKIIFQYRNSLIKYVQTLAHAPYSLHVLTASSETESHGEFSGILSRISFNAFSGINLRSCRIDVAFIIHSETH